MYMIYPWFGYVCWLCPWGRPARFRNIWMFLNKYGMMFLCASPSGTYTIKYIHPELHPTLVWLPHRYYSLNFTSSWLGGRLDYMSIQSVRCPWNFMVKLSDNNHTFARYWFGRRQLKHLLEKLGGRLVWHLKTDSFLCHVTYIFG